MIHNIENKSSLFLAATLLLGSWRAGGADASAPEIRTPAAPATPRINGPGIFGVRPGCPFLYTIPATGDRPMTFAASHLAVGLQVDAKTGQITGSLAKTGEYRV